MFPTGLETRMRWVLVVIEIQIPVIRSSEESEIAVDGHKWKNIWDEKVGELLILIKWLKGMEDCQ